MYARNIATDKKNEILIILISLHYHPYHLLSIYHVTYFLLVLISLTVLGGRGHLLGSSSSSSSASSSRSPLPTEPTRLMAPPLPSPSPLPLPMVGCWFWLGFGVEVGSGMSVSRGVVFGLGIQAGVGATLCRLFRHFVAILLLLPLPLHLAATLRVASCPLWRLCLPRPLHHCPYSRRSTTMLIAPMVCSRFG